MQKLRAWIRDSLHLHRLRRQFRLSDKARYRRLKDSSRRDLERYAQELREQRNPQESIPPASAGDSLWPTT